MTLLHPGAQTKRWGGVGPVRGLLSGNSSPAVFCDPNCYGKTLSLLVDAWLRTMTLKASKVNVPRL
jgi:hypothetical protein